MKFSILVTIDDGPGANFMEITQPLNQETTELRIRALLENGQTAKTTTQINLKINSILGYLEEGAWPQMNFIEF